ncbi:uncharacterized protein LOC117319322 isoform X3 [Pecten maximus]|uniref:uncharacterized protein LOC117319322 isoform X3 n=1 Tax=Pecten maximus TaxID=6579 RepID=UPI0014584788|nr:uncharacterized protein LOC117319322 isoform X3 [Pecten maximus]
MLDIFVITGTFIVARQSFSFISSQTCVLRHQYTDAGRWLSCGYRERKKNDENYEQKERERKKTARANRTEEQIQTDNIKSKERQKSMKRSRMRCQLPENGFKEKWILHDFRKKFMQTKARYGGQGYSASPLSEGHGQFRKRLQMGI